MEIWSREEWAKLTARVDRVVAAWARLECDPCIGRDDLAQELYLRSWDYWQHEHSIPSENLLRDWVWEILRRYGFRGATRGDLVSPADYYEAAVEDLEADENGVQPLGHPNLAPSAEREALREEFWARCSPALRAQLEELGAAKTWSELASLWGFSSAKECQRYVQGPLRVRMEREGVWDLLGKIVYLA